MFRVDKCRYDSVEGKCAVRASAEGAVLMEEVDIQDLMVSEAYRPCLRRWGMGLTRPPIVASAIVIW